MLTCAHEWMTYLWLDTEDCPFDEARHWDADGPSLAQQWYTARHILIHLHMLL